MSLKNYKRAAEAFAILKALNVMTSTEQSAIGERIKALVSEVRKAPVLPLSGERRLDDESDKDKPWNRRPLAAGERKGPSYEEFGDNMPDYRPKAKEEKENPAFAAFADKLMAPEPKKKGPKGKEQRETLALSKDQQRWLEWMLKGIGMAGGKKNFPLKEREEMEQLIGWGLVSFGKNHSGDTVGMYHMTEENKAKYKSINIIDAV